MGQDKALLELPGTGLNFLGAQIENLKPGCELVLVVAGANSDALKPTVYAGGAFLVSNPDPDRGQFSSLQVGLNEVLNRGRSRALITHVDRLPVLPATITRLKSRFAQVQRGSKWLVVPEFDGRHGHPVLAGREMIEAWLRSPVDATARDVEHVHQERIEYVSVDDASVVANINTPEEYQRLIQG
jgi:molybdenum cofactor cytidylyltransferase